MQFDPNTPDAYAQHLAKVNETNAVVATEDIVNQAGALLVPKGTCLKSQVVDRILQHKLTKPLEQIVAMENAICQNTLFEHLRSNASQYEDIEKLYKTSNAEDALKRACLVISQIPLLQQKITVLSMQLPQSYQEALFSAWLSLSLAKQQGKTEEKQIATFIAGLAHDIGLMHIDPNIIELKAHKETLTPEQWRAMQSHVLVGKLIIDSIPKLPKTIGMAVSEHHERCDGSGYPANKDKTQLSELGQVVALAETLYANRFDVLKTEGYGIKELLPFLQLNPQTFYFSNYQAASNLIRESDVEEISLASDATIEDIVRRVQNEINVLLFWTRTSRTLLLLLAKYSEDKKVSKLAKYIEVFLHNLIGSGLLNDGILRWSEHVGKSKIANAYREMEEIILMHRELFNHFQHIHSRLGTLLKENINFSPEDLGEINAIYRTMEQYKANQIPNDGIADFKFDDIFA